MLQHRKSPIAESGQVPTVPAELVHRCLGLFMQGVRSHTYSFDNAEYSKFENNFRKLEEQFASAFDTKDLLETLAQIIRVYDLYNEHCARYVASTFEEAKYINKLLLDELLKREFTAEHLAILQEVRQKIERARSMEQLSELRKNLELCLRTPALSLVADSSVVNDGMHHFGEVDLQVDKTGESPTGLRRRDKARDAMSRMITEQHSAYGIAIRFDCLPAIQARYGDEAAQDFLNAIAYSMVQALQRSDALFHWDRGCLFALLDRNMSHEFMVHEVQRLTHVKKQLRIEVGGRSVLFAVPTSADFFSITSKSNLQALTERVDQFALGEY